ncbi:helicase-related protein, partial [Hymenobacter coccineus]|uniref:helicase-related protein n=1 Tax=Hymenobacter coccineus TaxID=1908235 RepID=UPI0021CDBAE5
CHRPGERLAALVPAQVRAALGAHPEGDVLVFLPGVADLQRVARALDSLPDEIDLHLLHGELPLDVQDAALRPARAGRRKVILATSIAETSLTIEGVRVVVDGGFARVPRFVPRTGFTTLETRARSPRRRRPAPRPRRPPGPRHLLPPLDGGRAPPTARPPGPRNPGRRPQRPGPGAGPVGHRQPNRFALARRASRSGLRPGPGAFIAFRRGGNYR